MKKLIKKKYQLDHESFKWFLAGFIEGEGSVCISIKWKNSDKVQLQPEFFLYQHESGREILQRTRKLFRTGIIRYKSGSTNVLVYGITSRRSIYEKIIPFFDKYVYPYSCKDGTYENFRKIVCLMEEEKLHLQKGGLPYLIRLAYGMNPNAKGKKRPISLEEALIRLKSSETIR